MSLSLSIYIYFQLKWCKPFEDPLCKIVSDRTRTEPSGDWHRWDRGWLAVDRRLKPRQIPLFWSTPSWYKLRIGRWVPSLIGRAWVGNLRSSWCTWDQRQAIPVVWSRSSSRDIPKLWQFLMERHPILVLLLIDRASRPILYLQEMHCSCGGRRSFHRKVEGYSLSGAPWCPVVHSVAVQIFALCAGFGDDREGHSKDV